MHRMSTLHSYTPNQTGIPPSPTMRLTSRNALSIPGHDDFQYSTSRNHYSRGNRVDEEYYNTGFSTPRGYSTYYPKPSPSPRHQIISNHSYQNETQDHTTDYQNLIGTGYPVNEMSGNEGEMYDYSRLRMDSLPMKDMDLEFEEYSRNPLQPFDLNEPLQPLQPGPEEGPLKGKKGVAVAPSLLPAPTHEPAPTQLSATKQTAS